MGLSTVRKMNVAAEFGDGQRWRTGWGQDQPSAVDVPQKGTGNEGRGIDLLLNIWALNELYQKWEPFLQHQNSQSRSVELWFAHN